MSPLNLIFALSICGCCCVAVVGQWGRTRSRNRGSSSTSTQHNRLNASPRAQSPTTTLKPFPGFDVCPNGLNDEELSDCFTSGFADILPYLAREEGLPQIGIKGLDPQYIPNLILSKPAVFTISRTTRLLDVDFTFQKFIGRGWGHVEGHVFGIPLRWFTGNGTIYFDAEEVETSITFVFERREPGELFTVKRFSAKPKYFHGSSEGVHARWMERALNWLFSSNTTGNWIYKRLIEVHFLEIFKGIAARFMDPIYWNSIAGEHLD